jgi:hypothetical protein
MAEVVNFLDIRNSIKAKLADRKEEESTQRYYNNHDDVLDLCDEFFPEGAVIIAVDNDELQVSSTVEDSEVVYSMLFAAMKSLQDKMKE